MSKRQIEIINVWDDLECSTHNKYSCVYNFYLYIL